MTPYITRALAQQIVDTVRDLCGQNVNFIDCSGTIFASTDATRILFADADHLKYIQHRRIPHRNVP